MIILGIETSCDETALSLLEASGSEADPRFKILSTALFSQTKIHEQYGGVFPNLAKREHAKNLIPLLQKLLKDAGLEKEIENSEFEVTKEILQILDREHELKEDFQKYISTIEQPPINLIAVTHGPGLEPALWVGVNFAKALSKIWSIPVVPTNHMEGHIASVLIGTDSRVKNQELRIQFPAISLLISGGHTELVLVKKWGDYKVIGRTRDDAVGEAFDKVARMLNLPYPGGPHISRLAAQHREKNKSSETGFRLPRPMLHTDSYEFSFSGLKTAVLYTLRDHGTLTEEETQALAREFEDAVAEVLVKKTIAAVQEFGAHALIVGGGVVANTYIRRELEKNVQSSAPHTAVFFPDIEHSTDNATMIAAAGYLSHLRNSIHRSDLAFGAVGNLGLE